MWLLMRQCPLKYKECLLKRPLSGRVIRSFETQVTKATNGQKNSSAEDSKAEVNGQIMFSMIMKENKHV